MESLVRFKLAALARLGVFLLGINGFWVAHVDRIAIWLGILIGLITVLEYELRPKASATR